MRKKIAFILFTFFTFYTSLFPTDFYKNYYVDRFGDKTDEWYLCSENICGTSPNMIGGRTKFIAKLYMDNDDVFFDIRRHNGDAYGGDGFIYIKLENGELKAFLAKSISGSFYPDSEDVAELRDLILRENKIKVVVEIKNTAYSFNLGTIDLVTLHDILKSNKATE